MCVCICVRTDEEKKLCNRKKNISGVYVTDMYICERIDGVCPREHATATQVEIYAKLTYPLD